MARIIKQAEIKTQITNTYGTTITAFDTVILFTIYGTYIVTTLRSTASTAPVKAIDFHQFADYHGALDYFNQITKGDD